MGSDASKSTDFLRKHKERQERCRKRLEKGPADHLYFALVGTNLEGEMYPIGESAFLRTGCNDSGGRDHLGAVLSVHARGGSHGACSTPWCSSGSWLPIRPYSTERNFWSTRSSVTPRHRLSCITYGEIDQGVEAAWREEVNRRVADLE